MPSLRWLQCGQVNATACSEPQEAQQDYFIFSEMLSNWHLHDHFKITAQPSNKREGELQVRLLSKTHFGRAMILHFTKELF